MKDKNPAVVLICFLTLVLGGYGQAQSPQEVILKPVGNMVAFEMVEITAKAGSQLKVVMDNIATNPGMRHNFVLLNVGPDDESTIESIGIGAIQAGEAKDYVPDSKAILAYTPMADAGKTTEVVFTVPPPGDYSYICSYLGHYIQMRGVLHSIK
jgi:azurin